MRIAIVGGPNMPFEDISPDSFQGTPALFSYYLQRELRRLGVETVHCNIGGAFMLEEDADEFYGRLEVPDADHALAVEQRAFYDRGPAFVETLKAKIPGMLTTICDHNQSVGPEDMTFYSLDLPPHKTSTHIGLAVDPELCKPNKTDPAVRFNLLIDHSYYGPGEQEMAQSVCEQALQFALGRGGVQVRRFVSGGVETISRYKRDIYNRQGVPYSQACQEYSQAHVFLVTHRESLGYSVVECAMAGALVVVPKGCIKQSILRNINHIEWEGEIPWQEVERQARPELCRGEALKYDRWAKVAKIIYATLVG